MATKVQNEMFAKYMKEHPAQFPDSIRKSKKIAAKFAGVIAGKMSEVRKDRMLEWGHAAFMSGATRITPFGDLLSEGKAAAARAEMYEGV